MKNSTLVIVLLAGLNVAFLIDAFCFFDWIGKDCTAVPVDPGVTCACNDEHRYHNEKEGGGEHVTVDNARLYLDNFRRKYNTHSKGAFISKRAIDDLFCSNQEANGIFCYFGMKNESDESFVLLIEDGTRDETLIRRGEDDGHAVFMSGMMCPSICGVVGQ